MDGTPLPVALSGVTVKRLIEIDQALLYLITGALDFLVLREPLEQTGSLTEETAKNALSMALETYLNTEHFMTPVGASMMWHTVTPPLNWLICNGGLALKTQWPELFALWGTKYGGNATQFGLPNFTDLSPMGAGGTLLALDANAGAPTHTLTAAQIPAHAHPITDPGHVHPPLAPNTGFVMNKPASANTAPAGTVITGGVASTGSATTGISVNNNTGGGGAHNNLSPVFGVFMIVYAGRQA